MYHKEIGNDVIDVITGEGLIGLFECSNSLSPPEYPGPFRQARWSILIPCSQ